MSTNLEKFNLTDKEIALELTKTYVEHLNTRVNNAGNQSYSSVENIQQMYQYFYQTVSKLGE